MNTQRNRYVRRCMKAKRKRFQSGHRTSPSSYAQELYHWKLAWGVWSASYSKQTRRQADKLLRLVKWSRRNKAALLDW